jgi:hypothetical protein
MDRRARVSKEMKQTDEWFKQADEALEEYQ